jgi:hypothetical protein
MLFFISMAFANLSKVIMEDTKNYVYQHIHFSDAIRRFAASFLDGTGSQKTRRVLWAMRRA